MSQTLLNKGEPNDVSAFLERIRSTSWSILGLTTVVIVGMLLFNNTVFLRNPTPAFLSFVLKTSAGLVNGTLIASLLMLAATGIVIFGFARLRAYDVGWRLPELWWAVVFTVGFWIAMQFLLALVAAVSGELSVSETWKQGRTSVIIGGALGQLLGNAFVEETLMRGFYLPQFYLKAAQVYRRGTALTFAVLGSTLFFTVTHLPNRLLTGNIYGGSLLIDHVGLFMFGLIFAVALLITRNLFIAVSLHALFNEPVPIVQSGGLTVYVVWFGLTVFVLATWPLIRHFRVQR
jgi:membrane protease YdiL (CAAX protease family)